MKTEILNEIYQLNFGEPIFISAEQGDGLPDLFSEIIKRLP